MASIYKNKRGTWDVAWFDSSKKRHYQRGIPTKGMAATVAERHEFRKAAAKHGIITRDQEKQVLHAETPLETHLQEFAAALLAKGDTILHIQSTRRLVGRVFAAAGIDRIDQIDRNRVKVNCTTLKPAMEGTIALSIGSQNKALASCKTFTAWLFDAGRLDKDPLARAATKDTGRELTRRRVTLSDEQIAKLFETTKLQKRRGGMTGIDRAMRYALGLGTGFRQGTLFALTPESFHFETDPAYIVVEARNNKGRKRLEHPISPDLVTLFKPWLATKKAGMPIFPILPTAKAIKSYRQDLKAAGIVYHEAGTNLYCDLHAQRNTFITSIIRTAGLAVAQDLAHHSTPLLTAKYGRLGMQDYAKALQGLPKLAPPTPAMPTMKLVG